MCAANMKWKVSHIGFDLWLNGISEDFQRKLPISKFQLEHIHIGNMPKTLKATVYTQPLNGDANIPCGLFQVNFHVRIYVLIRNLTTIIMMMMMNVWITLPISLRK